MKVTVWPQDTQPCNFARALTKATWSAQSKKLLSLLANFIVRVENLENYYSDDGSKNNNDNNNNNDDAMAMVTIITILITMIVIMMLMLMMMISIAIIGW